MNLWEFEETLWQAHRDLKSMEMPESSRNDIKAGILAAIRATQEARSVIRCPVLEMIQ